MVKISIYIQDWDEKGRICSNQQLQYDSISGNSYLNPWISSYKSYIKTSEKWNFCSCPLGNYFSLRYKTVHFTCRLAQHFQFTRASEHQKTQSKWNKVLHMYCASCASIRLFSIPAAAWFPFEDCAANSNEDTIPSCSWTLSISLSSELVLGLWFATVVTLCKLLKKSTAFRTRSNLISGVNH